MRGLYVALAVVVTGIMVWFYVGLRNFPPFPGFGLLGTILFLAMLLLVVWIGFRRLKSRRPRGQSGTGSGWKSWVTQLLILVPFIWVGLVEFGDLYSRRQSVFVEATQLLQESEPGKNALGEPLKIGWPVGISSEESQDAGYIVLTIPVTGIHNRGVLRADGTKAGAGWVLNGATLTLRDAASSQITLLRPSATSP